MPRYLLAESRLKTCIALSRLASLILVVLFIPVCAQPLETSSVDLGLLIGVACALGYSTSWNFGCLVHYFATKKQPLFELSVFMDALTSVTGLLVAGVLLYLSGTNDDSSHVASYTPTTLAFAFLVTIGGLHYVSFGFISALFVIRPDGNFGTKNNPATLTRAPRASIVNSLAGRREVVGTLSLDILTRPEEATIKPQSNLPQRSSSSGSRTDLLPLYTVHDTTMPPAYEPKPASDC